MNWTLRSLLAGAAAFGVLSIPEFSTDAEARAVRPNPNIVRAGSQPRVFVKAGTRPQHLQTVRAGKRPQQLAIKAGTRPQQIAFNKAGPQQFSLRPGGNPGPRGYQGTVQPQTVSPQANQKQRPPQIPQQTFQPQSPQYPGLDPALQARIGQARTQQELDQLRTQVQNQAPYDPAGQIALANRQQTLQLCQMLGQTTCY